MNSDTIEKIEKFVQLNRKGQLAGKPVCWTLHAGNKKTPIASNYDVTDMQESLELLNDHLSLHTNVSKMLLKLRQSKGDSAPYDLYIQNPYYTGQSVAIGSFSGRSQGANMGMMPFIGMMQTQSQRHQELMLQMMQQNQKAASDNQKLKYEHMIERLEDQIGALEEQNKGIIGQLAEYLGPVIQNIAPVIIANIMGGGAAAQQPINGIGQEQPQQQPIDGVDVKKLTEGLRLLNTIFEDPAEVVLNLGKAAHKNPSGAHTIYEMIKQQANG
jgi:hypothetical protein